VSEFVLLQDIVIPAGTVLSRAADQRGGPGSVEAVIGLGKDSHAWFNMAVACIQDVPADLISPSE
jgi:hypothetical protein